MRKIILVCNCLQGVSVGCSGSQGSATNGFAQLRQGGVLFNKTAGRPRNEFNVRSAAPDYRAQRLRLIRTGNMRLMLDRRLAVPMLHAWAVYAISSVFAWGTSISPGWKLFGRPLDTRAESFFVERF
mgnify:CR=1 FL=1